MIDPVAMPEIVPPQNTGVPAQKQSVSSDFETFLRMLTAQIQNQNPLEPMEASDFAVQLATFSGVEQQVRTNDLLSQLAARQGLAEMAGWVGREALTRAPVHLDGTPQTLVAPRFDGADHAELVVSDMTGREVGRFAVDPRASEIPFDPPLSGSLPPGTYKISLEGFRAGNALGAEPVLSYARVSEARIEGGELLLMLEGGTKVERGEVVGLRH